MAASGYSPIKLYRSSTASNVPLAANLADGELAINTADEKLYFKNSSGTVKLLASSASAVNVSSISFGTTGLTPATGTTGAVTVAGTLITSNGGTGLSSYTAGDLIYYSSGTTLSKLGIGSNGQILTVSGGTLAWGAAPATGLTVGTTTVSSGTSGYILYNNAGTLGNLATTGSGNVVLATSPTLVTPALGTPSSGNLANCTFPTLNQNTTGSAGSVANALTAGTGITYSSGTTYNGSAAITISIGQAVATSSNVQFNSIGVNTAGSGTAGEIRATNNVTAFYSSDSRLKENIQDVDNALDKVCAIGSKTFDWTDEYIESRGGEDGYFVQKSDFGVIAQDVQAVFPQAVRIREDGTLAVDYEKLATLAFGAIQQLVKRVEALENK